MNDLTKTLRGQRMLSFLMPRNAASYATSRDQGWSTRTAKTLAGPVVDENLAYTYSAVWSATRLLSETVATLPLITYERVGDQDRRQATDLDLYDVLKNQVNPSMGSGAFRE